MDKINQVELVSSVSKVFGILTALSEQKEIGLSDLSARLMMSKATTYRFLQTMKSLGFVSQEGETDKYAFTLKLFELSAKSLDYVDLIEIADKEMRRIGELTNETVHLGTFDEDAIVYVHKIDSTYNLRMYSRVGRRNPLYSTAIGKILLAWKSDEFVKKCLSAITFVRHTENTLENTAQFIAQLKKVRQQFYAEDNEEQEAGLRCIAVPVYDHSGTVIAGLSISFPTIRFDENNIDEYVNLIKKAGKNISEKMGFNAYP
ncbi:DNA-binding transcriptional regulator KdgR [Enterobacteriaceae bacterium ESL0689]|nr:DNA-binding transcriptional regulator KdgR [Enterobacteriaceae bacterium ESL0689]